MIFRADQKNKMAALASDWLRHFRLLCFCPYSATFKLTSASIIYPKVCSPSLSLDKLFKATRLFVKINISYLNAFSLFIFKYRPVYITEATLNANNYIDICSIPPKFHMCMYERMKNIYAQNQSSIH